MILDIVLDRAVLLRMPNDLLVQLDRYVAVRKGIRTRTAAMRELLGDQLAVLEAERNRAARAQRGTL